MLNREEMVELSKGILHTSALGKSRIWTATIAAKLPWTSVHSDEKDMTEVVFFVQLPVILKQM